MEWRGRLLAGAPAGSPRPRAAAGAGERGRPAGAGSCYDELFALLTKMSDRNLAIVGAQWGDEGKGKIVDLLAPAFSIVARSQGGHNAGHTVLVGERQFILHLIPSGILHPGVTCVIGNGVVIDPRALFAEIDELAAQGVDLEGRLLVSDRAHVILPYHRDVEAAGGGAPRRRAHRHDVPAASGPSYEDKAGRRGIRVADLAGGRLAELVAGQRGGRGTAWCRASPWTGAKCTPWRRRGGRAWGPMVADVPAYLHEAMAGGRPVLFEGAQGALLDVDHGTYPYVTSSNATIGGVCTGLGVGPRAIGAVLGIAKAYTTRVGAGPLPTELDGRGGRPAPRGGPRVRRVDRTPAPLRLGSTPPRSGGRCASTASRRWR